MSKRHRILVFLALTAILGALFWFMLQRTPEPVYQGRYLSVWLTGYVQTADAPSTTGWKQADEAVRAAGTNAIPTLLRMFRAEDTAWKKFLWSMRLRYRFMRKLDLPEGSDILSYRAGQAFSTLGPQGRSAVSSLMELSVRSKDERKRSELASSLGSIGPEARAAIPLLIEGTDSADANLRISSVSAVGHIHAEPQIAVPALVEALRHADNNGTQAIAAGALAEFREDAKSAVPDLQEMVNGRNKSLAVEAAMALSKIDRQAAKSAVPRLVEFLEDQNGYIRSGAITALGELGGEATDAVPALMALLHGPDGKLVPGIALALHRIDAEKAKPTVPELIELLSDSNTNRSGFAAKVLNEIDPETAARIAAESARSKTTSEK